MKHDRQPNSSLSFLHLISGINFNDLIYWLQLISIFNFIEECVFNKTLFSLFIHDDRYLDWYRNWKHQTATENLDNFYWFLKKKI